MTWIQPNDQATSSSLRPTLTIATNYMVDVMALHEREVGCSYVGYDLLELHNIVDAPVTCIDARLDPFHVVVGFTLNTGPAQYFRVRHLCLLIIFLNTPPPSKLWGGGNLVCLWLSRSDCCLTLMGLVVMSVNSFAICFVCLFWQAFLFVLLCLASVRWFFFWRREGGRGEI